MPSQYTFSFILMTMHIMFILLLAIFGTYDASANAKDADKTRDMERNVIVPSPNPIKEIYPMFQDVHVMIFIGFGFLMTFLRRYGFSSVGLNMLIASFVIEWSMLFGGLLRLHNYHFTIGITNLVTSDFAAAAVLISFGALLGKTSPLQMLIVAFIEIVAYSLNEKIGTDIFGAVDIGGSMFIHVFGAYFGLACARMIYTDDVKENDAEGSNYHSDLFSMIGTIFLWLFWPSFNSTLAVGDEQHRAVINTYMSLAACCVTTFAISALVNKEGKFNMVHVQNATLAGGVAVGTSANMMINPMGALIIGTLAGFLSTIGFAFLTPLLSSKFNIHDTCGVNNLHGMPGVFAGLAGALFASLASEHQYGYSLYLIFPQRVPSANSTRFAEIEEHVHVEAGYGRTALEQGGYQLTALAATLIISSFAGAFTGLVLKLPIFDQPKGPGKVMVDNLLWETRDDYESGSSKQQRQQPGASDLQVLLEDQEENS